MRFDDGGNFALVNGTGDFVVIDQHALKAYKAASEGLSETHLLDVTVGRQVSARKSAKESKKFTEVLRERLQDRKN